MQTFLKPIFSTVGVISVVSPVLATFLFGLLTGCPALVVAQDIAGVPVVAYFYITLLPILFPLLSLLEISNRYPKYPETPKAFCSYRFGWRNPSTSSVVYTLLRETVHTISRFCEACRYRGRFGAPLFLLSV